jgi:G:T-mismatch repair DNA endonuclease (very short patch repair protein)
MNQASFCCLRCGHSWTPQKVGIPKECPNCHTYRWNIPKRIKKKHLCPVCNEPVLGSNHAVYCSKECRWTITKRPKSPEFCAKISDSNKGVPKPWMKGEKNPNFGNKAQNRPDVKQRFLDGSKARGQAWTDEERERHSQRMLGPSNKMRGHPHPPELHDQIVRKVRQNYLEGKVHFTHINISLAEKEIKTYLWECGVTFETQFHLQGIPFIYDFFLPDYNILIEYQGDYWHCNPDLYPSGTMLKFQRTGEILVDDVWIRDARKRNLAEALGYSVIYIWEKDFKTQGVAILTELLGEGT